jgi:hypothetical protein
MTWIIPASITFVVALCIVRFATDSPGVFGGGAIYNALIFLLGLSVALACWLVWLIVVSLT